MSREGPRPAGGPEAPRSAHDRAAPGGEGARRPPAGLCDSCRHQKLIRTGRGSEFSMCLLSRSDPRFPKYPRVPVLACDGYSGRSSTR